MIRFSFIFIGIHILPTRLDHQMEEKCRTMNLKNMELKQIKMEKIQVSKNFLNIVLKDILFKMDVLKINPSKLDTDTLFYRILHCG